MPLFIDLHIDNELTPEIIRECHIADRAIQEKYGVKYLQVLLNQPQGYLFCLAEAPNKEACALVHQEAHGNIACNILEITESDFSALLIGKKKDLRDFTLNDDGTLDTGTRTILVAHVLGLPKDQLATKKMIRRALDLQGGKKVESFKNEQAGIFGSPSAAIDAGLMLLEEVAKSRLEVEIRAGVYSGSPLEEKGDFFEGAYQTAMRLAFIANSGQIAVSSKAMQQYHGELTQADGRIKVVNLPNETFLNHLIQCAERVWDKSNVTITSFATELGISKSQLVRKLQSLTDLSPNDLLKEFRLRQAFHLMESGTMNVAEITMAVGFSNPSYFTKCFRKRFGKAPSRFSFTE